MGEEYREFTARNFDITIYEGGIRRIRELNATLKHHIERFSDEHPQLVRLLMLSLYVDDVVCGAETEVEAARQSISPCSTYSSSRGIQIHLQL